MYNIAICDDVEQDIHYIKHMLLKAGLDRGEVVFFKYQSGEKFLASFSNGVIYDLLVLDMQMKNMDGDVTAKEFRKSFPHAILVFCSGCCMPSTDTVETMPFRFLKKSYTEERMLTELKEVIAVMKKNKSEPFVHGHMYGAMIQLHPQDVLYIETAKRGSCIHKCVWKEDGEKEETFLSDNTIHQWYALLKDFEFACPHQSYIVNLRYIARIHKNQLIFTNGMALNISRNKSQEFKAMFLARVSNKYKY